MGFYYNDPYKLYVVNDHLMSCLLQKTNKQTKLNKEKKIQTHIHIYYLIETLSYILIKSYESVMTKKKDQI